MSDLVALHKSDPSVFNDVAEFSHSETVSGAMFGLIGEESGIPAALGVEESLRKLTRELNQQRDSSNKGGVRSKSEAYTHLQPIIKLTDQARAKIGRLPKSRSLRGWGHLLPILPILTGEQTQEEKRLYSRRITAISDVEGKTRVIGVLDYWSQTVLKPVHDKIMDILRKIPQDCTFDQGSFLSKLSKPNDDVYYSFDLTNATDRLPLELQKTVIGRILGKGNKLDAWARILTKIPFAHKADGKEYFYSCGQPMGAYSSWPSMAITHHAIIHVAGIRAGLKSLQGLYIVLGDDVVIAHSGLAREYRALLDTLDVPISKIKTHVSKDTYEFAKRWVHKGVEITPFPIPGVIAT
jgi:hypothetical protein